MKKIAYCGSLFLIATSALAQENSCGKLLDNTERLACYDLIYGRRELVVVPPAEPLKTAALAEVQTEQQVVTIVKDAQYEQIRRERLGSTMSERWELDASKSAGIFLPRPYKPMYVLPVTYSSRINSAPTSPGDGHGTGSGQDLRNMEAKFQFSFKSKLWENVLGMDANLWAGYTQSSRWQVYTPALSRPFRETNYEPEAMLVFHTPYEFLGWQGRISSISVNHQSNGRALPLSRSWNRLIGEVSLERGDWSLSLRPWWRIQEKTAADDNANIQDYLGRGEILLSNTMAQHVFTLQARHSLRSGANSRGSVQLDWAFPLVNGVHGYVQLFSGYGESLIDYNFRQNKVGLGVSLVEWR
ncbi:phospholipase A [soil metagenome]